MRDKYRLRFTKNGAMRFIGHLDLLKVFQRVIKRSNLPIAYSVGFNPHQQISFGLPLSIGMESEAEYVDLEFDNPIETELIKNALNAQMPEGLEITDAKAMAVGEKSSAALTEAAEYEITLPRNIDFSPQIEAVLAAGEIILPKKTKSGVSDTDIRPDIFSLKISGENKIFAVLAAGSARSVRPDLVVGHLFNIASEEYDPLEVRYKRVNLFKSTESGFKSLI